MIIAVDFTSAVSVVDILCAVVIMKNTYCLFQIKFITEYTNVQHIIITQI